MTFELMTGEIATQYIYRITDEGKKLVRHNVMPKVEAKLITQMKEIIEEYNEEDSTTVLSHVYRHFSRTEKL